MITINQIQCSLNEECTKSKIAKKLKCPQEDIISFKISKESIDARKNNVQFIYSVVAEVKNEKKHLKNKDVTEYHETQHVLPLISKTTSRPVVVGFGPSGMFAALYLAELGLNPIVLERGSEVDKRIDEVNDFWNEGVLNTESNVQFGEGGAGTFSDGKLTTRIKDTRVSKVILELIEAGAEERIRYEAHPHIGTDQLREIVKNIRKKIIKLGGEVQFNTKFEQLIFENNTITGVMANGVNIPTDTVFLCVGHSAKDTFKSLHNQQVFIEPKSFAIGLRVEHKQALINKAQYGSFCNHPRLKAAEYRITHTTSNTRGVYSFCMCPGGFVVPSSSDKNTVVVNGMSENARNQENANSALLVQIPTSDFYVNSPFDGFTFQEAIEKKAFQLGGSNYKAPVQLVEDYINNKISTSFKEVQPSYSLGTNFANLRDLFSNDVNDSLVEALHAFEKKITGFCDQGALLTGVETRSSCPIRLLRNSECESISTNNLYPCGEGAGYAGGIISSAVDGLRCVESYIKKIR